MFTKTIRRRYTGQQPRTKSGRRPTDKPRVKRGFCSSDGLHKVSFVRASKDMPKKLFFHRLENMEDACSWVDRPISVSSCPARLRPAVPPCANPSRPARGMSEFGIRQIENLLIHFLGTYYIGSNAFGFHSRICLA